MLNRTHIRSRDGFALPVALLAIMVIGAIVTGGFYASSQETRIAASSELGNQAFYVAEYGLEQKLGTWKNSRFDTLNALDTTYLEFGSEPVNVGGTQLGSYTISIRWLGPTMYLVRSRGTVQAGQRVSSREVGSIIRTVTPTMPAPTALALYGGLTVGGNSYIKGDDHCTAADSVAGVTAYDSTLITDQRDHIEGRPKVDQDTDLDTTGLSDFGATNLDELIANATKTYGPGESENNMDPVTTTDSLGNAVCDMSAQSNWGDTAQANPCSDQYPIIYAEGDFSLQTGSGQGVLIVEGNLHASGNFSFHGIVIVKGELSTDGTGNHFEGSTIVQGDGMLDSESTTLGNSLVQYNSCATQNALNANLRPRPLASRSWMDFTAITRGEADDSG